MGGSGGCGYDGVGDCGYDGGSSYHGVGGCDYEAFQSKSKMQNTKW